MVAAAKKNMGKMPCPHCSDPVAVMQAPTGTLSYKCQHADCEATGFASAHTAAARKWLAALGAPKSEPTEPAKPAQAAPAQPVPAPAPPAPAAKAPRPAFSLESL
jgi:hypothetical protein